MTRWHGITEDTYDQILIDSGAIYYDYTDVDNPGTLLGATRGGAVFIRRPKYTDLKYEGVTCNVVGEKHLLGYEVSLECSIITINDANLRKALPSADASDVTGYTTFSEGEWDNATVYNMDNIVLIANRANGGDPIILKILNPLCVSDFNAPFKDKSETVSKWKFVAYCTEAQAQTGASPWSIEIPNGSTGLGLAIVGLNGSSTYFRSADGINWLTGTLPYVRDWATIIFGGGLVVMISLSDDEAAWSEDGVNWTGFLMPTSSIWSDGIYGGGTFVAIAGTIVSYSSDGKNWTNTTCPNNGTWVLAYGNGVFTSIAFNRATTNYSTDGISWNGGTILNKGWRDLVFDSAHGVFVAVNASSPSSQQVGRSTDGVNWTYHQISVAFYYWYCIAYGDINGGTLVALTNVGGGSTAVAYSTDGGLNWTVGAVPTARQFAKVVYVDGVFAAFVFNSNLFVYSSDGGLNWTETTTPLSAIVLKARYG